MVLAGWWGDKFNRLYLNAVNPPNIKSVEVTVDLLPNAASPPSKTPGWLARGATRRRRGVKVFLRPYRGDSLERDFTLKIPAGLANGEHRIMLSDAETINRMQTVAGMINRYMDLPETVSLMNQERSNDRLYVSLLDPVRPRTTTTRPCPACPPRF